MECSPNATLLQHKATTRWLDATPGRFPPHGFGVRQAKRLFWLGVTGLFAMLYLGGCASSDSKPKPQPETAPVPTGSPEVIIEGKTAEQIGSEVRRFFIGRGYQERSTDHAYKLAFDRPDVETKPGRPPETALRVRLTLRPLATGTHRLSAYSYRVEKWKQMLEADFPVSYGLPQIQALLNQIKANLDAAR